MIKYLNSAVTKIKGFCSILLFEVVGVVSPKYRHIKTGNVYRLVAITNEFTNRSGFVKTAVYLSEDTMLYSRPMHIFNEKFERV